jgi:hypothetical protein
MSTNFPNGLSSRGVPVIPGKLTTGKVFFVDAATGSDGHSGKNTTRPFATLNKAVGMCTADKGDVIYLMPNHYEDIGDTSTTGAIDLDVAGISVIGIGNGSNMPRFDFNDADSDFLVGANNVLLENVNFEATVTIVKLGVAIEAGVTGTTFRNCKFSVETSATDEFLIAVNILAGCNDTLIEGCRMDMGLGGAATGIKLVGASADVSVVNNLIKGDYSLGCVAGITTLSTEVLIANNIFMNGGSGNIGAVACVSMLTGTTGYVIANEVFCNVATVDVMMLADTMLFSRNYANEDVGEAADSIVWGAANSVTVMADG